MKAYRLAILTTTLLFLIVTTSCQDVFTTSAFSSVEVDMSKMSDAQMVSYAEDLLAAGPPVGEAEQEAYYAKLQAAYDAIFDQLPPDLSKADSDLLILAADLAVGTSGIGSAVSGALSAFGSGDTENLTTDLLTNIDTTNLSSAVELMQAAEAIEGVDLTPDQYANAAAAQLLVVIDDADGVDNLGSVDPADSGLVQAQAWALEGGVDLSSMLGDLTIPE